MDSGQLTAKKASWRAFNLGLGVKLLLCIFVTTPFLPEAKAQDRPAIARPDPSNKSNAPLKTSEKKVAVVEETKGPSVDIGKILPEGRSLRGVKLPSYTGDRLSSLMTAVTMKRLDGKHLDMEDLRIIMYAESGEENTLISTERGIYDLAKEEITSDTRTRIEQDGVFDLEGDTMIFDAVTQKGKMTGNVKMLLYKMDGNLMPKQSENQEAAGIEKREGDGK